MREDNKISPQRYERMELREESAQWKQVRKPITCEELHSEHSLIVETQQRSTLSTQLYTATPEAAEYCASESAIPPWPHYDQ